MKHVFWLAALTGWIAVTVPDVCAWNVYNLTGRQIFAEVYRGGSRTWAEFIDPSVENGKGCHFANTSCNPGGNPLNELILFVQTVDGVADYVGRITMQAGGYAQIHERPRSFMGAPHDLYVVSLTADSQVFDFDSWDHERGWANRHVRFLISADCQYSMENEAINIAERNRSDAVNERMQAFKYSGRHIRGILYAGDLTHTTAMNEWDHFKGSVAGFERFLFHGLGNHDVAVPTTSQMIACEFGLRAGCVDPVEIRQHVRDLKRATRKTAKGDPHYSWDWHDVHFVQLNIFPANLPPSYVPDPHAPTPNNYPDHNPMNALTFLVDDLRTFVGDTGRPVILIHHYGFDTFSTGQKAENGTNSFWWTERQREHYWNAIRNYNVAGIFTGHLHLGSDDLNWHILWKPTNAVSEVSIPTFIAGAALNSVFLDVEMDSSDRMSVTRRDQNGTALTNVTVCLRRAIRHANTASAGTQDGTALYPFRFVTDAVNSLGAIAPDCNRIPEIQLYTGNYAEPVRITRPARLTARGGMARVGL